MQISTPGRHTESPPAAIAGRLLTALILWSGYSPLCNPAEPDSQPRAMELSSVIGDFTGDGFMDRAILAASPDDPDQADLLIYTGDASGALRLTLTKGGLVWRGALAGTEPSLEVTPRGSLVVKSANEAVGRNRWHQALTLAHREGRLLVAGYTYTSRDTLDPAGDVACDVNLLTGKGQRNRKVFRSQAAAVPLSEWSDAAIPRQCQ